MLNFRWLRAGFLPAALSLAVLSACGDDGETTDMAVDVAEDTPVEDMAPRVCEEALEGPEPGTMDPVADPFGAAPGETRVGILQAADVPDNPLLNWRADDIVLANSRLAMIIDATDIGDGYVPWGGKIVGLAHLEDGAIAEVIDFNETIVGLGAQTVRPSSITIVNNGADGGAAVVRVIGNLTMIPFVGSLGAILGRADLSEMVAQVDFTLEPDASDVHVSWTIYNDTPYAAAINQLFLAFQGQRLQAFDANGFSLPMDVIDWVGYALPNQRGHAFIPDDTMTKLLIEISGATGFQGPRLAFDPCARTEIPGHRYVVGRYPGMDGIVQTLAELDGESQDVIEGTLLEAEGIPAEGVLVFAEQGESIVSRTITDADGNFTLHVPEGAEVQLRAWRTGAPMVGPWDPSEDAPLLGEHATLNLTITDQDSNPIPARVQLWQSEPRGIADRYGLPRQLGQFTHVLFPTTGTLTVDLPAGDYTLYVSRGYEYDMFESDLSFAEGGSEDVTALLDHVVDTTGIMCADYHIHTSRSPDSPDGPAWKLTAAAADGLDIPCRSDHDYVLGWEDLVHEGGLEQWLYGLSAMELTTFTWGHFGVVPIQPRPELRNGGAVDWAGRSPADVFADAHALPSSPILIVNHPRSAAIQGYFTAVGLDPATLTVEHPELWSEDFEAVEAFNDSTFDEASAEVADWFGLLNHGRRVFAVSGSDSHKLLGNSPVGYPRTCLRLGVDTAEDLRTMDPDNTVRDATRDGHFVVSGGIYLDVEGRDGVRPGDTLTGAGATELIHVRVQAAPWIQTQDLEVYVDGVLVDTFDISGGTDVIRFEEDIEVSGGQYVVFHARGAGTLGMVHPGKVPFGVSMPIFFER